MSITKSGHNKWVVKVSIRDPNKATPVTKRAVVTGTRAEAVLVEADMLKELKARSLTSAFASTFAEAVDIYVQKATISSGSHRQMIGFLRRELGHIRLEIFPEHFAAYRKALAAKPTIQGKPRKAASINRYTAIVGAVFNHLVNLEVLDRNPITKVKFPMGQEKPRDRYLSDVERRMLLDAVEKHRPFALPIIRFMLAVPCRVRELTEARREQYNPSTNTIYIPDSKAGIPIYKPVPTSMVDYFRGIPADCPYLFYKAEHGHYKPLTYALRKAWVYCLRKAGISDMRIHDLRHMAVTDLCRAGNLPHDVAAAAGWTSTAMLKNYYHLDGLWSAQNMVFKEAAAG